jgi:excisionase family DNA binding protein
MKEDLHPPAVVLYTVAEAAPQLRMSRATLYRLVKEGKVPHRKIKGVGVGFTPDDLAAILEDAHRPAVA